ncbi:MAG: sugar phosphate isomerase/epimerase [Treponema sp.]|nr:sugar phosphate isomerase/epimerase [Treponema sp.]
MKLAISNLAWNAGQNEAAYALMREYGFTGLEVAPTKIIADRPYSHLAEAESWARDLKVRYGFSIPSMQSIWYGRMEKLFGTEEERATLLAYTKAAVDFAGAIGCGNLVFGCPKNRNRPDGADGKVAVRFFRELGDYAASKGTCIGMEANPAIYGTNFVNGTEEALELIDDVSSDGFKLNLDIGAMIQNGEALSLLQDRLPLINHVHVSEPMLKKIGPRSLHQDLVHFLKEARYDRFISVEMGLQESMDELEAVMGYIAKIAS